MKGSKKLYWLLALLTLAGMFARAAVLAPVPVIGDWEGRIDTADKTLQIVLHVRASKDGTLVATADNVTKKEQGLTVEVIRFTGVSVHLEIGGGAVYEGVLDKAGRRIVGDIRQGGRIFPLYFERVLEHGATNGKGV